MKFLIDVGVIIAIIISLLNILVTVHLINSGKSYYIHVNDAFRLFSVNWMLSVQLLIMVEWTESKQGYAFHVISKNNPILFALILLMWSYYVFGVVGMSFVQYRRVIHKEDHYMMDTIHDSERIWYSWSNRQLIKWIISCNILSRSSIREILTNGVYGAIIHRLSIDDLKNLNLSLGEANKLYDRIQRLVRENDGGFSRREEIRSKIYEHQTSKSTPQNNRTAMVESLYSVLPSPQNPHKLQLQENDLQDMQAKAENLMKTKYGLTLPSVDSAKPSVSAETNNYSVHNDDYRLSDSAVVESGVFSSNHESLPPILEASDVKLYQILSNMPPEIRSIAERHPEMMSQIMNRTNNKVNHITEPDSDYGNDCNDMASNDKVLLKKLKGSFDDVHDEEWGSSSDERQSLIPHSTRDYDNVALRRRTKR